MWKILEERNGKFVDSGIRVESDPDSWINRQHLMDGKSYAAEEYKSSLLGWIKGSWKRFVK